MRFTDSVPIRRFIQAIILIWAAFVIFLYVVHHHHWLENLEGDIPRVFLSVFQFIVLKMLWAVGFLIAGYGLGRGILDLCRISSALDTTEDDFVFSVAVGWGLIGLGTFLLGSMGFLKLPLYIILWIVIIAATSRQLIAFGKKLSGAWKGVDLSRIEFLMLLTISAIAVWGLFPSLVPEWGFDSLNSHLPAPAAYLADGKITFHPEINFNNFPQTVEMWYMLSMMFIPTSCAQLLMNVCHLLTCLAVFTAARRFFGRGPALAAVLIYMLVKKVYLFAVLAYIDQGLVLMIVLGFYAALRYMEKPSKSLAVLVGLLLGFACGIKYSAMINTLMIAIMVIVYEPFSKRNGIRLTLDILIALAVLAIVACPWYIRNWIWFHNPVFPFYSDLFTAGGTYVHLIGDLKVDHRTMLDMFSLPLGIRWNLYAFFILPYSMTFEPYSPYDTQGVGSVGPWYLIFLPLVIFVRKWPKIIWAIVGLIVTTYAFWWFGQRMLHLRYMLPVFALQSIFTGYIVWEGLKPAKVNPRGIAGWTSMALVFGILVTFFAGLVVPEQIRSEFPIFPEEREQFQSSRMNALPAVTGLNESLLEALGDEEAVRQTRIYGFYMEQYRWFADFRLIGNQIGYADHDDYLNHCASARDLHDWLVDYDCSYLVINLPYARLAFDEQNQSNLNRAVPGLSLGEIDNMPGWEEYFDYQQSLWDIFIFRVR